MIGTTQEQWVRKQLKENGKVSRNEALRTYISRLGAIIFNLKEAGWDIEGEWVKTDHGKDFVYHLKDRPTKRVSKVDIIDGKAVERFVDVPV